MTETTLDGKHALKLVYSLTGGGPLDDDATANGTIVNPVGLAVANGTVAPGAPNSGAGAAVSVQVLAITAILPLLALIAQRLRHRR